MSIAEKYDGFIFDLDGTVYRGDNLIAGADHTINYLKENNKKVIFISNKTTGSASDYYNILKNYGVNAELNEIVTATITIRKYLSSLHAGQTFYAIGEDLFIREITDGGLKYSDNPGDVDIVLITLDRYITPEKITTAASALMRGARFFAANIDMTCPVEDGEIVDAGTTINDLEQRTNRRLEDHFGKPSMYMMREISERISIPKEKLLLLGDRLETDIKMANSYGIDSALVSTGVSHARLSDNSVKPTYYLNSVYDLLTAECR